MQVIEIAKVIYRRLVINNDIKRLYQNLVINHCERSRYGRRLRRIKNTHNGEKCVIVGNGPSLTATDLDAIHNAGIITFGTNRVFKIFSDTKWRPTYYVTEDPNIVHGCEEDIDRLPAQSMFMPLQIKWYETNKKFKNTTFFWLNYDENKKINHGFSPVIDKQIDHSGTVTCTCLQIAVYMGFSEIYLIGIDHNFKVVINEEGNTVINNEVKNHFCDHYDDDIQSSIPDNTPNVDMRKTTQGYRNARAYCEEHNIKIYNSTRGGRLEVFERKLLEEMLEK